ncbi:MAG: hypothetical protein M3Z04_25265 [Chloroflexota bacterium]|nr:hypothetical protein [Chloroflexota bacterium]
MDIRAYWLLPPAEQAAMRAAVLLPEKRRPRQSPVPVIAYPPDRHADPFGVTELFCKNCTFSSAAR